MLRYTTDAKENMALTEIEMAEGAVGEMKQVRIHPDITYQTFKGMGGAITEAAGFTYAAMSDANKEKLADLYFGKDGIGYTMGRLHIQSSDFSVDNYAYISDPSDRELNSFNMDRDEKYIFPLVRAALDRQKDMEFIATPWSPPAFMKTNNDMNHGGKLKEEFADMWADMISKYVNTARSKGINVTRVSTQNEPAATQTWDSCVYNATEEAEFVVNHLKPSLVRNGLEDIKIGAWDHNKEILVDRIEESFNVPGAKDAIDAILFHWYTGDHFEELAEIKRRYPDKEVLFTEGCVEYSRYKSDNQIYYAEMYAHEIIGDFTAGCDAFMDWNIYLNEEGGPNHVGNFCDAPVMCDTKNDIIDVKKSFYYIGHISKFVKPGAKRVLASTYSSDLEVLAFVNPDGSKVAIVLNRTDNDKEFVLYDKAQSVNTTMKAHSIATFIW